MFSIRLCGSAPDDKHAPYDTCIHSIPKSEAAIYLDIKMVLINIPYVFFRLL